MTHRELFNIASDKFTKMCEGSNTNEFDGFRPFEDHTYIPCNTREWNPVLGTPFPGGIMYTTFSCFMKTDYSGNSFNTDTDCSNKSSKRNPAEVDSKSRRKSRPNSYPSIDSSIAMNPVLIVLQDWGTLCHYKKRCVYKRTYTSLQNAISIISSPQRECESECCQPDSHHVFHDCTNLLFVNFWLGLRASSNRSGVYKGMKDEGYLTACKEFHKTIVKDLKPEFIFYFGKSLRQTAACSLRDAGLRTKVTVMNRRKYCDHQSVVLDSKVDLGQLP